MEATVDQPQEESTVVARLRKLRWLPVREQTAIEEFAVQGRPVRFLIGLSSIFFLFFIPAVRRSTGIGLKPILVFWSVLAVWFTLANRLLYRRASRSRGAFYALVFGSMALAFSSPCRCRSSAGNPTARSGAATPSWPASSVRPRPSHLS